MEDDNPNFKQLYRLSEMDKALVQTRIVELLDAGLVELFRGEYVSTTWMLTKDIFGNWIKRNMCGDYRLMNKRTCSDKYAMPLSKEIFHALGWAKVFNTLDLKSGYH